LVYLKLVAYPAEGGLLLVPAVLGGTWSIRYTARLELATVVPCALARCRLSKLHHRPARIARATSAVSPDHRPARVAAIGPCLICTTQRRRVREARAASVVAPCRFSTAYFVEIGNFAPFSKFLYIKGRKFSGCFLSVHVYVWPYNHEKVHGNRFPISGIQTHRQTEVATLYI